MTGVHIEQVDERDSSWEDDKPRFRVYLHASGDSSTHGWTDTYDITGADVLQVIDWAQKQAGDALTYAVALVCDDDAQDQRDPGRGRGLVWLVGMDGNDTVATSREAETQERMLQRRRQPVRVSPTDSMPPDAPNPYGDGSRPRESR